MILITGATGFLGSELAEQLLEKGAVIRCLKREHSMIPDRLAGRPVEWVDADLLDPFALEEAFAGVEEVYHCAALVSFKTTDKRKMHRVNAEGTANVVNLCLQHTVRKLVHVSSVAAVGEAKGGGLINENDHWEFSQLQSGYAISKYEGEMEVWRGIAEGLNAVIVNPSVIIGEHAGPAGSGKIFGTVRKGLAFYTPGSVGIVDVRDVALAMILLMESDRLNERFILNAENLSFKALFSEIAAGYTLAPPRIKLNRLAMALAWRAAKLRSIFTRKETSLTRETASGAFGHHDFSNAKFLAACPGFHFIPVKESIRKICEATKGMPG